MSLIETVIACHACKGEKMRSVYDIDASTRAMDDWRRREDERRERDRKEHDEWKQSHAEWLALPWWKRRRSREPWMPWSSGIWFGPPFPIYRFGPCPTCNGTGLLKVVADDAKIPVLNGSAPKEP